MHLRKTRTHLQGASNRPQTQLSRTHPALSLAKTAALTTLKHPFASFASKKRHQLKGSCSQSDFILERSNFHGGVVDPEPEVQSSLRLKFKNSKNIVKLLRHWGFKSKGYLTREQFKEKVQKTTGSEPSPSELDQMMLRHSQSTQHLDTQGLISLLLGKTEGIPMDSANLPTQQNSPAREHLVNLLQEDLKNYAKNDKAQLTEDTINALVAKINTGVSRMKQANDGSISNTKSQFFSDIKQLSHFSQFQQQMLTQVEKGVNFREMYQLMQVHKNADYLLVDPILRRTKESAEVAKKEGEDTEFGQTFGCKMKSLPNLFSKTLNAKEKRAPFDPVSLLNVDQRKTRFDQSNFTHQSNGWTPSGFSSSVQPEQKSKLMQTLRDESDLKQARYLNKLNKMRANRQQQQENVGAREEFARQRETVRLERMRDQQQAYNYVNFIKKKWE